MDTSITEDWRYENANAVLKALEEIETISEGGQGKVIRVLDKDKVKLDLSAIPDLADVKQFSRKFSI